MSLALNLPTLIPSTSEHRISITKKQPPLATP